MPLQLFSGTLNADGVKPIEVKGSIVRETRTDERTGFTVSEFVGVLMVHRFSNPGFWDFDLETDIGFRSFIRITDVYHHYHGQIYLLHFGSVGSPITLPSDGSLGAI